MKLTNQSEQLNLNEFKEKLLEGFDLKKLKSHFKLSRTEVVDCIKELQDSNKLTGGFFDRFMERESTLKSMKRIENIREQILEGLLVGKSVEEMTRDFHMKWKYVKMTKDLLIEEGAFNEYLYRFNVVEFLDRWKRGMSINEMFKEGVVSRSRVKIRKCRDWLLKNGWILPR